MKKMMPLFFLFVICALIFPRSVARADGIIVPPRPPCREGECPIPLPRPMSQLEIRYHHVTVSIKNQLVKTHVDQVFYNPNEWPVEGIYIFPLPVGSVVTSFILWVDGQPVNGKVLSTEEARNYYEEVVRELRDPALLEYIGQGALQASIFPVPPRGERRIELEYAQALSAENGLVRFVYPLNTEKFSLQPLQDVSVQVEILDSQPIRAVYSSSHAVALDRKSESSVVVGYEEKNALPDTDFVMYYSLGEQEAFHLFSYRDPTDSSELDGFFLLLLAPKPETGNERVAKDVLLVLDRSGSMEGEKFTQARSALRYILERLGDKDRFYLQAFSTGIETYASVLRPVSEVDEAVGWVDRLSAQGSTDINRALLEAVAAADRERPTYLIFLTDGLPTQGVVDTGEILRNFSGAVPDNVRLFTFGVGYDVDTVLLDTLSQDHHGQSTYVRPEENLDEILSAFYQRISTPVLTDLALDFGPITTYDIYPDPLPDLFSGSQVIVAGRYREGGKADIILTGEVNGERKTIRFPQQVFDTDSRGKPSSFHSLPRLWATRKIGYLLNKIRLDGSDQETIQQIVKLSIRYGIVTPYTSYLVTEPMPLGVQEQEKIVNDAYGLSLDDPLETTGKSAVDRAAQEGQMQAAEVAPSVPFSLTDGASGADEITTVRVVGPRTFIRQGGIWIDTTFDPEMMPAQKILFLSEAYFTLLKNRPDLAPVLALGDQLILVLGGRALEITRIGEETEFILIPSPLPIQSPEETGEALSPLLGSTPAIATPKATVNNIPVESPVPSGGSCASLALIPLAIMMMRWKKTTS